MSSSICRRWWSRDNRLYCFLILHLSDVEFRRITFLGFFRTLSPVIPICICEELSCLLIVSCSDRAWARLCTLEFALVVLVPKEVASILTIWRKGVALLVECESVYCINLRRLAVHAFRVIVYSVTLETEIIIRIDNAASIKVYVLDSASPLNRANCVAFAISKACDASSCVLKGWLSNSDWLEFASKNLSEIPVMNDHLWMSSDQQGELSTHVMNGFP